MYGGVCVHWLGGTFQQNDPAFNETNQFLMNFIQLTDSWESKWTYSEFPGKEFGKFELTAGKFFNDEEADKGKYVA